MEQRLPAHNRKEAQRLAHEWDLREEKIRRGYEVDPENLTLQELWVKYEPQAKRMPSWVSLRGRFKKHILPELGHKLISHIRPVDIEQLIQDEKKTLAPQTRDHLRVHMSAILSFAVKNRYLRENPAKLVKKLHIPDPEPKALTVDQVQAVILGATPESRLLLLTAAFTAMRKGELLGLTWSNVDLVGRFIRVEHSYGGATKSKRKRTVPIPWALVPHLEEARAVSSSRYVFPTPGGKMRNKEFDAAAIFKTALRRAGLVQHYELRCVTKGRRKGCGKVGESEKKKLATCPKCGRPTETFPIPMDLSFKDLRSTFITHLVEQTGDIRAGQAIGGHGQERTTARHYAKQRALHLQAQVDRAFALPSQTGPTSATTSDQDRPSETTTRQRKPTTDND